MRTTQPAIDTAQMKLKMGTDPSLSSDIEEGFMAGVKNLAQTYYNAILSENIQKFGHPDVVVTKKHKKITKTLKRLSVINN